MTRLTIDKYLIAVSFLFMIITSLSSQEASLEKNVTDQLSLYIFLLDDCPICIDYTNKINTLYDRYGTDVEFIGYFPNFSSKPQKIEAFKNKFNIQFELKTDYYKKVSTAWNIKVTPEVILYDKNDKTILYRGRIDNRFYKLGRRRNVVTSNELEEAIQSALAGKLPAVKETEPIGCFINYNDIKIKN